MIIDIGTKIDLVDLIQSRLLIQANSGGGKSVLARALVEACYNKVPFIIADVEGEYYTLKEKYGDILIIGGRHGDIPMSIKNAALMPKEIIGNRLSVVLDLSDLKMGDRILYVKNFVEAMMELNSQYWVNYLVFIEEAHKLCGEQDKQASATAIKDLMSRGRKRGYCGVLITQRISKLHKDAAAECNNKFIGKTFLDIDMERSAKELGLTAHTDKNILRTLKHGSFYAFGNSIVPNAVHEVKINMPKTKIPKAGVNLDIKPKPLTEKVKAMLAKFNVLDQPKSQVLTVKAPIFTGKSYEAEYKSALATNKDLLSQLQAKDKFIVSIKTQTQSAIKLLLKIPEIGIQTIPKPIETVRHPNAVSSIKKTPKGPEESLSLPAYTGSVQGLGKCPAAILTFLASFPDRSFSKPQIGIAAGYSHTSGSFGNAIGELNIKQLIIKTGDKIKVSGNAMELFGSDFVPREYSIHTYSDKLGKCEREIYEVLLACPNDCFTKEELAGQTPSNYSPTSGSFGNALGKLNTLELTKREGGQIRLNPELLEL